MKGSSGGNFARGLLLGLTLFLAAGMALFYFVKIRTLRDVPGSTTSAAGTAPASAPAPQEKGKSGADEGIAGLPGEASEEDKASATEVMPPQVPPSLHGIVRDAAGDGIEDARVAALHVEDWEGAVKENQGKVSGARDPRSAFELFSKIYEERLKQVPRTRSGKGGKYEFRGLKPGDYRLLAAHSEFLPRTDIWAEVPAEGSPGSADIELLQGYAIAGNIADEKGLPVEGARVKVTPSSRGQGGGLARMVVRFMDIFDGNIVLEPEPVLSGKDGAFRATPLEPVAHDLRVEKPGHDPVDAPRVPAGTEGLLLRLPRGQAMTARVLDPELQPVKDAEWEVRQALPRGGTRNPLLLISPDVDLTGEKALRGKTSQDGRIELSGLKRGLHDLELRAPGYPAGKYRVEVREGTGDLGDFVLEKPLTISGRVLDPSGKPAADVKVWVPEPPDKDGVEVAGLGRDPAVLAEARTGAGGKFVVGPLPGGSFEVHALTEDFAEAIQEDVAAGSASLDLRLSEGLLVQGQVLDRDSREPIPRARVTVRSEPPRTATTDDDGLFVVRGVAAPRSGAKGQAEDPARRVYLQVVHPDYRSEMKEVRPGKPADSQPEQIFLGRREVIQGVVIDAQGNPIQHARVRLEVPGVPEFIFAIEGGGSERQVFTARDGTFQIQYPGGGPGDARQRIELVASHPAHSTGRVRLEDLKGKEGGYADAQIILTAGATVTGRVTGPDGQPIPGARVRLNRETGGMTRDAILFALVMPPAGGKVAYSNKQGEYRLGGIEPGTYQLEAEAIGFAGKQLPGTAVGERGLVQDLVLESGGSIRGFVMAASGAPLAGIEVVAFLRVEPAGSEERLREIEAIQSYAGRGSAQARTGEDGRYELSHLPDGQYTVVGRAQGYAAAEAAGVKPGEQAPDLMLSRLGAFRVKVTAAATSLPVTSYSLEIERIREAGERRTPLEGDSSRQEANDPDGMHVREGMMPGSYWITVKASRCATVTRKCQVLEGQDNLVEVRLEPGALVEALVSDEETGSPLGGASVYCRRISDDGLQASRGPHDSESRETGEDGLASFDTLSAGRYSISVWHPSYFPAQRESLAIEIPRDEGNRFELKLRSGGGIQGNFTNISKTGSSLVGYEIILRPVESQEVAKDSTGSRRTDAGGDATQPSPAVGLPRERSTRVNPEGGGFELGGLPPGKYDLFLRKRAIRRLEDGAVIRPQEEPVQVGTVEIRPGETQTLKLEVP